MADPIPGVIYTRVYPSTAWTAPGRPSLGGGLAVLDETPLDSTFVLS